jgi:hypothetical protein
MKVFCRSPSSSGLAIPIPVSPLHKVASFPPARDLLFLLTWVLSSSMNCHHCTDYPPCADRDGTIDILIITCSFVSLSTGLGNNCVLNIAYNTQLPLCSSSSSFPFASDPAAATPCRSPSALCVADPNFSFIFSGPVCLFSLPKAKSNHLQSLTTACERNGRTMSAFRSAICCRAMQSSMSSTRPSHPRNLSCRVQAMPIWTASPTCFWSHKATCASCSLSLAHVACRDAQRLVPAVGGARCARGSSRSRTSRTHGAQCLLISMRTERST